MDTEDDALPHKPATLQVEFIRQTLTPIIIIIEVQYLLSITTPLFKKIQHLCSLIFTSNNYIYSWGSALQELGKLNSFQLFTTNIKIQEDDVQDTYDISQKQSLQKTIKYEFKEYLNKTATLSEWACGVDLSLGTYIPDNVVGPERTYRMREEKKHRAILKEYAINDVFAVTRLSYKLNLIQFSPTSYYEDIPEDEEDLNVQQELSIDIQSLPEELIVHVTDELEVTNENELSNQPHDDIEPTRQINDQPYESNDINTIHVEQDVIELQLNDDMDIQSLPEIMKVHFYHEPSRPHLQQHHNEQSSIQQMTVHVTNEQHQVSNSHHLGPNPTTTFTSKQLRNRKTNRRHRINRYRYEVIRQVYRLFSITKIKRILRSMNIFYVNINMVRHKLFIGLKNQTMVDEVEKILHNRIFTKQHYHRLYR
ncbi:unnamed protein product [Rotaria sp. Silwood1]|nr:unnamed protein product [Rotaria sp. Silwood1]